MYTIFLVCAVLGGSVFLFQFILSILGAGSDALDGADGMDVPGDVDIPDDLHVPHDVSDPPGQVIDHGSTWFFGVLTFKTVVAALLFFGLGGILAMEANLPPWYSMMVAVAAGIGAMYGVHYLMQMLYRLRHDGTARIERTVGRRGTVYIPVPADRTGRGKIQIRVQSRIMEYSAVTASPSELPTGTPVEVTRVVGPTLVEVQPTTQPAKVAEHATSTP